MPATRPPARAFRQRLRDRQHVLGTFIKIPTSHTIEIIGQLGYDFVIVDQEHAPFGRSEIDVACLAARAANIAAIVPRARGQRRHDHGGAGLRGHRRDGAALRLSQ